MVWKDEPLAKTAILVVLMAWIASNEVDASNTIANMIIDGVFIFYVYHRWYITRVELWRILWAITLVQMIWHGVAPFLLDFSVKGELWYYLAIRNGLYVLQLPVIGWYAHGSVRFSKG